MGFPGQFRIPGHSGTDKKHKKAFTKWRKWQREDALTYENGSRTSARTGRYESEYSIPTYIKKWFLIVGIPIIFLAVGSLSYLVFNAGDGLISSYKKAEVVIDSPHNDVERLNAFLFYDKLANRWLEKGDYEEALANFNQALKMAPYSKRARLGLIKVLEHYCEYGESYCVEAAEQRAFVDGMGWRSDS